MICSIELDFFKTLNSTTYLTARQQHQPLRNHKHWFNQHSNTLILVSCFRQFVLSEKNVSVNKRRKRIGTNNMLKHK